MLWPKWGQGENGLCVRSENWVYRTPIDGNLNGKKIKMTINHHFLGKRFSDKPKRAGKMIDQSKDRLRSACIVCIPLLLSLLLFTLSVFLVLQISFSNMHMLQGERWLLLRCWLCWFNRSGWGSANRKGLTLLLNPSKPKISKDKDFSW